MRSSLLLYDTGPRPSRPNRYPMVPLIPQRALARPRPGVAGAVLSLELVMELDVSTDACLSLVRSPCGDTTELDGESQSPSMRCRRDEAAYVNASTLGPKYSDDLLTMRDTLASALLLNPPAM
jgi:hypothetical protein